jgi:uncharacterized membrane protein
MVMGMGIVLGTLLLIVPGVILAFGWSMAPFYVIDAGLGPMSALRMSWGATKGQKGKLFGLAMLSAAIGFGGLFACGVGIIPAFCVVYVAWAIVFTRISGREPALPDPTVR